MLGATDKKIADTCAEHLWVLRSCSVCKCKTISLRSYPRRELSDSSFDATPWSSIRKVRPGHSSSLSGTGYEYGSHSLTFIYWRRAYDSLFYLFAGRAPPVPYSVFCRSVYCCVCRYEPPFEMVFGKMRLERLVPAGDGCCLSNLSLKARRPRR